MENDSGSLSGFLAVFVLVKGMGLWCVCGVVCRDLLVWLQTVRGVGKVPLQVYEREASSSVLLSNVQKLPFEGFIYVS